MFGPKSCDSCVTEFIPLVYVNRREGMYGSSGCDPTIVEFGSSIRGSKSSCGKVKHLVLRCDLGGVR